MVRTSFTEKKQKKWKKKSELIVVQMAALRGNISFRYLKQFFLVFI
jgi:hypothetical protein